MLKSQKSLTYCEWMAPYQYMYRWNKRQTDKNSNLNSPNQKTPTWLSLVECCCRNIYVEHHFPLGRPHRLMETEPDLTTTSERVVVTVGCREKTSAHRSVGHRRLDRIENVQWRSYILNQRNRQKKICQCSRGHSERMLFSIVVPVPF